MFLVLPLPSLPVRRVMLLIGYQDAAADYVFQLFSRQPLRADAYANVNGHIG